MNKTPESKQFWRLCGPLLLYWVILFVARIIVEVIAMVPHLGQVIDYSAFTGSMTKNDFMNLAMKNAGKMMEIIQHYQVQILGAAALFTVPLTLTLFLADRKRDRVLNIPQNNKAKIWKYSGIIVLGAAVSIGINCLSAMSKLALSSAQYEQTSAMFYAAPVWVQFLCLGLIIPLTEEFMFRGVLFKRFREQGGFFRSALISSLLFALTHSNVVQLLYSFILGMFLAYVYEKYGSFKAPAVLHIAANITSLALTNTKVFTWLAAEPLRMGIAAVGCAFAGSVIFVLIQRIQEKPQGTKPPGTNNITTDMFR